MWVHICTGLLWDAQYAVKIDDTIFVHVASGGLLSQPWNRPRSGKLKCSGSWGQSRIPVGKKEWRYTSVLQNGRQQVASTASCRECGWIERFPTKARDHLTCAACGPIVIHDKPGCSSLNRLQLLYALTGVRDPCSCSILHIRSYRRIPYHCALISLGHLAWFLLRNGIVIQMGFLDQVVRYCDTKILAWFGYGYVVAVGGLYRVALVCDYDDLRLWRVEGHLPVFLPLL